MSEGNAPRYIIAGQLTRDYVILPSGKPLLDVPGGNLIYAAAGLTIWEPDSCPGLVARVGEDYPQEWIDSFQSYGLDVSGIRVLPEALDLRSFNVYSDRAYHSTEDPVTHFARLGLPFPKALLGYRPPSSAMPDSRTQLKATSLRQVDIPPHYLEATAAHLCPLDYLTHSLLPAVFRQAGFTTITLDPSRGYMTPVFWNDLPSLLTGLTAFLPNEDEIRSLFFGRSTDPWEMCEALAAFGVDFIVIKRGEGGQLLYDAASRSRWEIPAYPSRVIDPSGAGDAFCGGFLTGYRKTYDPLLAVLHGNIASSLVIEGQGAFYAMDALPGLANARLEAIKENVRKV